MPRKRYPSSLLALLSLTLLDCGPAMPTETEARTAYTAQKTHLDNVDAALRKAIAEIPHFGVPLDSLPCTPPPPQKTPIPGLGKLVEAAHCTEQQGKALDARAEAMRGFESKTLPELVKQRNLIGLYATYKRPGDSSNIVIGKAGGAPPLYRNGTVRAEQGITVDDRRVGWGIYHDPAADNADRRGLEVVWNFQHEQAKVRALVFLWID